MGAVALPDDMILTQDKLPGDSNQKYTKDEISRIRSTLVPIRLDRYGYEKLDKINRAGHISFLLSKEDDLSTKYYAMANMHLPINAFDFSVDIPPTSGSKSKHPDSFWRIRFKSRLVDTEPISICPRRCERRRYKNVITISTTPVNRDDKRIDRARAIDLSFLRSDEENIVYYTTQKTTIYGNDKGNDKFGPVFNLLEFRFKPDDVPAPRRNRLLPVVIE